MNKIAKGTIVCLIWELTFLSGHIVLAQSDDAVLEWIELAAANQLPAAETDSVLFLAKNTNRNQVHYEVKVENNCVPLARDPIFAYWREFEKGDQVTSNLLLWERPGYGVRQPRQVSVLDNGGYFEFSIRGVPDRSIWMQTFAASGKCLARAFTQIAGQIALFQRIEIEVSGWANVNRVEIFGLSVAAGMPVQEVTHAD